MTYIKVPSIFSYNRYKANAVYLYCKEKYGAPSPFWYYDVTDSKIMIVDDEEAMYIKLKFEL